MRSGESSVHGHVPQGRHKAKMPHMRYLRKNSMDSGSVKHCMMTRGTVGELIPSFRSQIDRRDEQMCDIHHFGPQGPLSGRGVQMVRMPYLRTTVVDFNSETCPVIVSYNAYDNEASFRIEIDNCGA